MTPDWSAAYTQNAGPMDAMCKIQLTEHREPSAQEYASKIRAAVKNEPRFADLEFAFDTGGLIRGALNEGKSTPLNIRVTGKDLAKAGADRRDDSGSRSRRSKGSSTPGFSSARTIRSSSSTSTGPRPPTWG